MNTEKLSQYAKGVVAGVGAVVIWLNGVVAIANTFTDGHINDDEWSLIYTTVASLLISAGVTIGVIKQPNAPLKK